jgi:N-acetylmuramoyl-L-alanine amidase
VKLRPDLGILRLTNMPAVLNEGAFVDNQKDIQDWNEDAELQKLGIAYAEAAAEFLGLAKKAAENALYRVQVGAYRNPNGANAMQQSLKAAGFDGIIVKTSQ